jgi:glycosyltransferase involved in cell wall biosynthesis
LRFLFLVYRDFTNPNAVGGDFYLWELARGLAKLGNKVTLLCSSFQGAKSSEIIEGVEINRINSVWRLPLKIFSEYLRKLKGNFNVIVEEAIGGQRLPYFGTIYVNEPLVAVWHQRHNKVFREQYPFPIALFLSLFEFFQARLYRNRTIVTPSEGAKEKLMLLGFKSEKLKVVYDGVGSIFDSAKTKSARENVLVYLGKLRRYKRPDHAILALVQVLKRAKKPCKLIIAGKASEIDRGYIDWLRNLAKRLNVGDLVEFRINISEKEKLNLLEKARLLVQPSPVEGFSIVVAEANRCGTPVVASDGVPRDVVINGLNGLVYCFGDIEALAMNIVRLIDDDVLWDKMSKDAREWSQQFTWENSVAEFLKVLIQTGHREQSG